MSCAVSSSRPCLSEGYVVTVGGVACDILIQCPALSLKQDVKSYLVFEEGTKIDVANLQYTVGGGAANTAYVLARLGLPVVAFFKTGSDYAADFIRSDLVKNGIDVTFSVSDKDMSTGTSFVLPSLNGNHTILVCRGSNALVYEYELPSDLLKNSKGVYIAPLAGNFASILPLIAKSAHGQGFVMHNPSKSGITEHFQALFEALASIDILMLNRAEAELCSVRLQKDTTVFELEAFCREVSAHGPRIILVTDGEQGVYCFSEGKFLYQQSIAIPICTTVGAGDTFGATFFGALVKGYSLERALRYGVLNSAALLSNAQPHGGLLSFDELKERTNKL